MKINDKNRDKIVEKVEGINQQTSSQYSGRENNRWEQSFNKELKRLTNNDKNCNNQIVEEKKIMD